MKIFTTLFLLVLSVHVFGQITIDKFSLPKKGDILKTKIVANPEINVGSSMGPNTWDFSNLEAGVESNVELKDPSLGTVDIEADFLITEGNIIERYYQVDNSGDINEIYLRTIDPIFESFELSAAYFESGIYRKSYLGYGISFSSTSEYGAPLALSALPDTLTSGLPLGIDSIRFNTIVASDSEIDAYGKVILPDAEWEVLREKKTINTSITVYGYVSLVSQWIEIPEVTLEAALGDLAELLKPRTNYQYNFYSDQAIEIIASIDSPNEDGSEPTMTRYKADETITNIQNIVHAGEISAYPNPTFGDINFNLSGLQNGVYSIKVYNVLGQTKFETKLEKTNNESVIKRNIEGVEKGTYFYSVFNATGQKIDTKRIVIIKP